MKKSNLFLLSFLALGFIVGCSDKYDDSEVWNELEKQAVRIAALEKWQETVNSNINTLQGLVAALQENDYVTGVTAFDTPAPGGYYVTFSKSGLATIWNGAKGETGETGADGEDAVAPVIGVDEYPEDSGVYYWTLDGEFIEAGGKKLPVTGPKGDPGEDGQDGSDGGNGTMPKLQINTTTNYWEVSYDGGATWESLDVAATGPRGPKGATGDAIFAGAPVDKGDYYEFTLAGTPTTTIELPKYKEISISFNPPGAFIAGEERDVPYTSTGSFAPTNIRVVDIPAGWKITVSSDKFIVKAPETITADNAGGEATILVADDYRVAAMYGLPLNSLSGKTIGSVYYQNGVAAGIVFVSDGGVPGKGRVISLDEGKNLMWSTSNNNTGAIEQRDGLSNMKTIYDYANGDFTAYPAFAWVDSKNPAGTTYASGATDVWYLPAYYEYEDFYAVWDRDRTTFDNYLTGAGGTGFAAELWYYHSSTESLDTHSYAFDFEDNQALEPNKSHDMHVRAMLTF